MKKTLTTILCMLLALLTAAAFAAACNTPDSPDHPVADSSVTESSEPEKSNPDTSDENSATEISKAEESLPEDSDSRESSIPESSEQTSDEPSKPSEESRPDDSSSPDDSNCSEVSDCPEDPETPTAREMKDAVLAYLKDADAKVSAFATDDYLTFISDSYGETVIETVYHELKDGTYSNGIWHQLTGNSAVVLYDIYSGALDRNSDAYRSDIRVLDNPGKTANICVIGDISLADNFDIFPKLLERENGLEGILSKDVIEILQNADITVANNEFCFSDRGEPMERKMYTFRANPENISYMQELGIDLVTLANNHVYDFGKDAFLDTLATLSDGNIPYIGAGKDISEAKKPFYFIVNGYKYAFTAATRAEKFILTPEATENSPGVLRMYDPTAYVGVIAEAEAQSDCNIAYVHWGKEDSHKTEDGLYDTAKLMIDAGADIIIGAHAHILQGIAYYKDVPILYNLGNFIFDDDVVETGILQLEFDESGSMKIRFIPCLQEDCYTALTDGEQAKHTLDLLRGLSPKVKIDKNGYITEK